MVNWNLFGDGDEDWLSSEAKRRAKGGMSSELIRDARNFHKSIFDITSVRQRQGVDEEVSMARAAKTYMRDIRANKVMSAFDVLEDLQLAREEGNIEGFKVKTIGRMGGRTQQVIEIIQKPRHSMEPPATSYMRLSRAGWVVGNRDGNISGGFRIQSRESFRESLAAFTTGGKDGANRDHRSQHLPHAMSTRGSSFYDTSSLTNAQSMQLWTTVPLQGVNRQERKAALDLLRQGNPFLVQTKDKAGDGAFDIRQTLRAGMAAARSSLDTLFIPKAKRLPQYGVGPSGFGTSASGRALQVYDSPVTIDGFTDRFNVGFETRALHTEQVGEGMDWRGRGYAHVQEEASIFRGSGVAANTYYGRRKNDDFTGMVYGGTIRQLSKMTGRKFNSNYDFIAIDAVEDGTDETLIRLRKMTAESSGKSVMGTKAGEMVVNQSAMPRIMPERHDPRLIAAMSGQIEENAFHVDRFGNLPDAGELPGYAFSALLGRYAPLGRQAMKQDYHKYLNSLRDRGEKVSRSAYGAYSDRTGRLSDEGLEMFQRWGLDSLQDSAYYAEREEIWSRDTYEQNKKLTVGTSSTNKWNNIDGKTAYATLLGETDDGRVRVKTANWYVQTARMMRSAPGPMGDKMRLSHEQIRTIGSTNVAMGAALSNIFEGGASRGPAHMLRLAEEASKQANPDILTRQGYKTIDINDVDMREVRSQAQQRTANYNELLPADRAMALAGAMRSVIGSDTFLKGSVTGEDGGIKDYYLPPAEYAQQMSVASDDGNRLLSGFAESYTGLLNVMVDAQDHLQPQEAVNTQAFKTVSDMFSFNRNENVRKSAMGLEVKRMGGMAKALEGLQDNEVVLSRRALSRATGLTQKELKAMTSEGGLDGRTLNMIGIRHPQANPAASVMGLNVLWAEDKETRKRFGRTVNLNRMGRNVYMSKGAQEALMGDFDKDLNYFFSNWMRNKKTGEIVGGNIDASTPEEIARIAKLAAGSESRKGAETRQERLSVFRGRLGSFVQARKNISGTKGRTVTDMIDSWDEMVSQKGQIGTVYNNYIRKLFPVYEAMLGLAGAEPNTKMYRQNVEAMGRLSQFAYQGLLDLAGSNENVTKMMDTLTAWDYDANTKHGRPARGMVWSPETQQTTWHANVLEGMEAALDSAARFGSGGWSVNEKGKGSFGNEDFEKYIAPNIARVLTPLSKQGGREGQRIQREMTKWVVDYNKNPVGMTDASRKQLFSIFGNEYRSVADLFHGGQSGKLENLSPMAAALYGISMMRHQERRQDPAKGDVADKATPPVGKEIEDQIYRASYYAKMYSDAAKTNDLDKMRAIMGHMPKGISPEAYNSLMNVYGAQGGTEQNAFIAGLRRDAVGETIVDRGDFGLRVERNAGKYGRVPFNPNIPVDPTRIDSGTVGHLSPSSIGRAFGETEQQWKRRLAAQIAVPKAYLEDDEFRQAAGLAKKGYFGPGAGTNAAEIGTKMHDAMAKMVFGSSLQEGVNSEVDVYDRELMTRGRIDVLDRGNNLVLDFKTMQQDNWDNFNPANASATYDIADYTYQLASYLGGDRADMVSGIVPVSQAYQDDVAGGLEASYQSVQSLLKRKEAPTGFQGRDAAWWAESNVPGGNTSRWSAWKTETRKLNKRFNKGKSQRLGFIPVHRQIAEENRQEIKQVVDLARSMGVADNSVLKKVDARFGTALEVAASFNEAYAGGGNDIGKPMPGSIAADIAAGKDDINIATHGAGMGGGAAGGGSSGGGGGSAGGGGGGGDSEDDDAGRRRGSGRRYTGTRSPGYEREMRDYLKQMAAKSGSESVRQFALRGKDVKAATAAFTRLQQIITPEMARNFQLSPNLADGKTDIGSQIQDIAFNASQGQYEGAVLKDATQLMTAMDTLQDVAGRASQSAKAPWNRAMQRSIEQSVKPYLDESRPERRTLLGEQLGMAQVLMEDEKSKGIPKQLASALENLEKVVKRSSSVYQEASESVARMGSVSEQTVAAMQYSVQQYDQVNKVIGQMRGEAGAREGGLSPEMAGIAKKMGIAKASDDGSIYLDEDAIQQKMGGDTAASIQGMRGLLELETEAADASKYSREELMAGKGATWRARRAKAFEAGVFGEGANLNRIEGRAELRQMAGGMMDGFNLFYAQRALGMLARPAMSAAQQYESVEAAKLQMMYRTGMFNDKRSGAGATPSVVTDGPMALMDAAPALTAKADVVPPAQRSVAASQGALSELKSGSLASGAGREYIPKPVYPVLDGRPPGDETALSMLPRGVLAPRVDAILQAPQASESGISYRRRNLNVPQAADATTEMRPPSQPIPDLTNLSVPQPAIHRTSQRPVKPTFPETPLLPTPAMVLDGGRLLEAFAEMSEGRTPLTGTQTPQSFLDHVLSGRPHQIPVVRPPATLEEVTRLDRVAQDMGAGIAPSTFGTRRLSPGEYYARRSAEPGADLVGPPMVLDGGEMFDAFSDISEGRAPRTSWKRYRQPIRAGDHLAVIEGMERLDLAASDMSAGRLPSIFGQSYKRFEEPTPPMTAAQSLVRLSQAASDLAAGRPLSIFGTPPANAQQLTGGVALSAAQPGVGGLAAAASPSSTGATGQGKPADVTSSFGMQLASSLISQTSGAVAKAQEASPLSMLMETEYGRVATRQQQRAAGTLAYGEAAYKAYSPFLDMVMTEDMAGSGLGALAAIGLPALGVGLAGNKMLGGVNVRNAIGTMGKLANRPGIAGMLPTTGMNGAFLGMGIGTIAATAMAFGGLYNYGAQQGRDLATMRDPGSFGAYMGRASLRLEGLFNGNNAEHQAQWLRAASAPDLKKMVSMYLDGTVPDIFDKDALAPGFSPAASSVLMDDLAAVPMYTGIDSMGNEISPSSFEQRSKMGARIYNYLATNPDASINGIADLDAVFKGTDLESWYSSTNPASRATLLDRYKAVANRYDRPSLATIGQVLAPYSHADIVGEQYRQWFDAIGAPGLSILNVNDDSNDAGNTAALDMYATIRRYISDPQQQVEMIPSMVEAYAKGYTSDVIGKAFAQRQAAYGKTLVTPGQGADLVSILSEIQGYESPEIGELSMDLKTGWLKAANDARYRSNRPLMGEESITQAMLEDANLGNLITAADTYESSYLTRYMRSGNDPLLGRIKNAARSGDALSFERLSAAADASPAPELLARAASYGVGGTPISIAESTLANRFQTDGEAGQRNEAMTLFGRYITGSGRAGITRSAREYMDQLGSFADLSNTMTMRGQSLTGAMVVAGEAWGFDTSTTGGFEAMLAASGDYFTGDRADLLGRIDTQGDKIMQINAARRASGLDSIDYTANRDLALLEDVRTSSPYVNMMQQRAQLSGSRPGVASGSASAFGNIISLLRSSPQDAVRRFGQLATAAGSLDGLGMLGYSSRQIGQVAGQASELGEDQFGTFLQMAGSVVGGIGSYMAGSKFASADDPLAQRAMQQLLTGDTAALQTMGALGQSSLASFKGRDYFGAFGNIRGEGNQFSRITDNLNNVVGTDYFAEAESILMRGVAGGMKFDRDGDISRAGQQIATLSAAGGSIESILASRASAAGVNTANDAAMNKFVADELPALLQQIASGDLGDIIKESVTAGTMEALETSAKRSGRSFVRNTRTMSAVENPLTADTFTGVRTFGDMLSAEQTGAYYGAMPYLSIMETQASDPGMVPTVNRQLGQFRSAYGHLSQFQAMGASPVTIGAAAGSLAMLGGAEFATRMAVGSGNMGAISMNFDLAQRMFSGGQMSEYWQSTFGTDSIPFAPIDTATGRAWHVDNISDVEYAAMQKYDIYGKMSGLDKSVVQGGTRAMAAKAHQIQMGMIGYQASMQKYMTDTSNALMTGGGTIGEGGFLVPGSTDGLAGAKALFARQGFTLNIGNGMSQWEVADRQEMIQREKQDWQMMRQAQELEHASKSRDLQVRQFNEKWNFQWGKAQYQYDYSKAEMQIGRAQSLTQRDWNREDMAYNRGKSQLEFGWQMQDTDENLRYARGRDRISMLREKGRNVVRFSMEQSRADVSENRFEKQAEWEDAAFKRSEEHFEKNREFQIEEMEMEKRHFEERMALDDEAMARKREDHAKELAWMLELRTLEDQNRLLSRQHQLMSAEMGVRMAMAAAGAQKAVAELQAGIEVAHETTQEMQNGMKWFTETGLPLLKVLMPEFNKNTSIMGQIVQTTTGYILNLINQVQAKLNQPESYTQGANGPGFYNDVASGGAIRGGGDLLRQMVVPMAEGGATGFGNKYTSAGLFELHAGEYVVPQDGTLVLRGDNPQTTALLREIAHLLRDIRNQKSGSNITVYTQKVDRSMIDDAERIYAHSGV